ncbi:nicotinate phosphoribosyltransferase [Leptotrichia sp. OH3620_COT-345]|uniref:nicotinate phosphoribosyltransferase n=1 Tax=Leptotrichia sp. OH3620_COT-345 TaxID=2491048 RepID=UPI000F653526|nr:nicotinate phosphoribosyltransferase [Leptotrichia sp. OH3620_COT-345]RRD39729.1 nicotinate phosphoribosyltransferase [Leptotrichia sp. OH3620_COT-345]
MKNLILMTDSYKMTHPKQYPENMTYMHDYIESRGGLYGYTKFFGLQYYLKEYLTKTVTEEMVKEAEEICTLHGLPFFKDGWNYIVKNLNGKLPLRIRAVPEGAVVKNHNVLVTIESTDSNVPWIVGWVETLLLKIWYPITVATFSYKAKQIIEYFLKETGDNVKDELPFKLHDFGYRGVSSEESAGIGGLAHLTNFMGTDTLQSLVFAKKYYHSEMGGFSIPASEHSTMTSWTRKYEKEAYENMLDSFPNGTIAIVLDSYDYFNAVENIIGKQLREKIQNRNGILVIRPDSGDAITNILFALESLENNFGYTINSKGYKVINKVRIIQGDGINENIIWDIYKSLKDNGYSAENVALGCGGSLLQGNSDSHINRDTHKFAMKCSCIKIGDKITDVYKNPITDRGKVSKKGRLDLIKTESGNYTTVNISHLKENKYHKNSVLELVYENGILKKDYTLDEVRSNEYLLFSPSNILNLFSKKE